VAVKELDERQRIAVLKTLSETFRIQQEHYIECAERMEKCRTMVNDLNTTLGGVLFVFLFVHLASTSIYVICL
jgi:hypothetical protein